MQFFVHCILQKCVLPLFRYFFINIPGVTCLKLELLIPLTLLQLKQTFCLFTKIREERDVEKKEDKNAVKELPQLEKIKEIQNSN